MENVYIHDRIYEYMVNLIDATRNHPDLGLGASPRGTIALVRMSRAAGNGLPGQGFCFYAGCERPVSGGDQTPGIIEQKGGNGGEEERRYSAGSIWILLKSHHLERRDI